MSFMLQHLHNGWQVLYTLQFIVQSYALLKIIPESFFVFVDMNYEVTSSRQNKH